MAGARRPRAPLPRYAVAWFPRFEGIDTPVYGLQEVHHKA